MVRITVDTDVRIGAGMCALTLPEVFDQDEDDGTVVLREPLPPAEHEAAARRAAGLCPSGAITTS